MAPSSTSLSVALMLALSSPTESSLHKHNQLQLNSKTHEQIHQNVQTQQNRKTTTVSLKSAKDTQLKAIQQTLPGQYPELCHIKNNSEHLCVKACCKCTKTLHLKAEKTWKQKADGIADNRVIVSSCTTFIHSPLNLINTPAFRWDQSR